MKHDYRFEQIEDAGGGIYKCSKCGFIATEPENDETQCSGEIGKIIPYPSICDDCQNKGLLSTHEGMTYCYCDAGQQLKKSDALNNIINISRNEFYAFVRSGLKRIKDRDIWLQRLLANPEQATQDDVRKLVTRTLVLEEAIRDIVSHCMCQAQGRAFREKSKSRESQKSN